MNPEEILLDVRDMEPPEPYELATATLSNLQPGQYVRMISPRRPRLLYPWLTEHGFREATLEHDENNYEIIIWSGSDLSVSEFIARQY